MRVLKYDLRRIVRNAPRLTFTVNLVVGPLIFAWIWYAASNGISTVGVMWGLIPLCAVAFFFGGLMIAALEDTGCLIVFVEILGVYYWCAAMWKLYQIVRGKRRFPPLKS